MFVAVARVTLDIPQSGSLKAKRQVLRRVSDRVKARFNVSVAEVDDQDKWQRATLAMAVVGNDRRHVNEMMDKILQYVEDMYVAPVAERQMEIITLGERLYGDGEEGEGAAPLEIPKGERSLAEAEGMGAWEERHRSSPRGGPAPAAPGKKPGRLSLEEARARARALRNKREWEDK
ncbi:MAG TPA: DUF503 domain-containing protein [Myxococcales bacterium]|jgi:uncharacterized protein YlxP (DUF503 family)|nr:DUF503 domain-containing protein [Myxococcales bacterium]